jgi:sugar phosphate permease
MPSGHRQQPWVVFVVAWFAYVGFYLCRVNLGVLMPVFASQGLSKSQLAMVILAFSVTYCIGQFQMGAMADRVGPRITVTAGMAVSAVATALLGFHPTLATLIALQSINGLAQATGWSSLVKLMTRSFSKGRRGVTMGWWTTNYVVGGFLATILVSYAISAPWLRDLGWKRGVWLPALILLALCGAYYMLVPSEETPSLAEEGKLGPLLHSVARQTLVVLQNRHLIFLASAYFFVKMIRYSLSFWLPFYLVDYLRMTPAGAGYLASVFPIAGLAGVVAAGYISDHVFRARRFPVAIVFNVCFAATCLLIAVVHHSPRHPPLLSIGIMGLFCFGADSLMVGVATQDSVDEAQVGSAAGVVDGFGSIGILVSPVMIAAVVQHSGWPSVFIVLAISALICAGVLWCGVQRESSRAMQLTT